MIYSLFAILVSMAVIWKASDWFEGSSSYLGRNLSDGVRGATINAIGSSIPELLTAFIALVVYTNKEGFAFGVGTTAGSAIFNSAIIPALVIGTVVFAGIVTKVKVSKKVVIRDGLFLIVAEFALISLLSKNELTMETGLSLIGIYVAYLCVLFSTMTRGGKDSEAEFESSMTTGRAWVNLIWAIVVIGGACHVLVIACYELGAALNIKSYFVAVILAAAATSVPDTIISMKDAKKGEYDDAVANALGSNIFDICVCLGLPLIIYCYATGETIIIGVGNAGNVAELRVLLLFFTVVIFGLFLIGDGLGKIKAFLMFGTYVSFVTFIVARANEVQWATQIGGYLQNFLTYL